MRKRSKFMVLLLSCLMVFSMLPTVVFAADEIATAKNGTTITKNTTQAELDAWAGEGAITTQLVDGVTIITLQKDFKLGKLGGNNAKASQPISFGIYPDSQNDKMIFDLNGHILASDTMVIVSRCDLTIKDSVGTGKVFMDTSDSKASAFEAIVNQRKLTIQSGTYEAKVHSTSSTTGVVGSAVADVETVIEGGSFIGSSSAVNVKSGTTTITGGNFNAASYGIVARGSAVVNFPANSQAEIISTQFPIVVGSNNGTIGEVHINGGHFDGTNASALVGRIGDIDSTQFVTIGGGRFTQDPTNYAGTIPVAQVGDPFIVGAESINEAVKVIDAGTIVNVTNGNVDLTNVPDNVIVENKGSGDVSVNGEPVAPSESHITHTHSWGEPVYTWSADHMTCTAQRICLKDTSHIETATATITVDETIAPTCTEKGVATYTATFSENWTSPQVITEPIMATGHKYGEPKWTWSEDGKNAKATFICDNDNCHIQEIVANVTGQVKEEANCTENGTTTYIAKVSFNGQEYTAIKDIPDIAALGHRFVDGVCNVCSISDPNYKGSESTNSPQTSDNSNIMLWFALLFISAGGVGTALFFKRKKVEK